MPKPVGTIAILFGAPSRFADERGPDQDLHDDGDMPNPDEGLGDDEQGADGGDDERGPDCLTTIYHGLKAGSEKAAHVAMGIARALQGMVHEASRGNDQGLVRWHNEVLDLGNSLGDDDNG